MECLRSFIIDYQISGSLDTLPDCDYAIYFNGPYNTMASAILNITQNPSDTAVFKPTGYKNIDVYGIKLLGHIASNPSAGQNGIITNWGVQINAVGNYGKISSSNGGIGINYTINTNPLTLGLNNLNNEIKFYDPIGSLSNISIQRILFDVEKLQSGSSFAFVSNIALLVYYKFEGE